MDHNPNAHGGRSRLLLIRASAKNASLMLSVLADAGLEATVLRSTKEPGQGARTTILAGIDADQLQRVSAVMQEIGDASWARTRGGTPSSNGKANVFAGSVASREQA